jgi:S-formylglutathione hydrolase FrmB
MTWKHNGMGELIRSELTIVPQNSVAATVAGASIDRAAQPSMPRSAEVTLMLGALTGTPTAVSAVMTLQDSADDSTWASVLDKDGNAVTVTVAAASTLARVDVDLSGARQYIRGNLVLGFTAGTTPTADLTAQLALSGYEILPV